MAPQHVDYTSTLITFQQNHPRIISWLQKQCNSICRCKHAIQCPHRCPVITQGDSETRCGPASRSRTEGNFLNGPTRVPAGARARPGPPGSTEHKWAGLNKAAALVRDRPKQVTQINIDVPLDSSIAPCRFLGREGESSHTLHTSSP
jgi:hypothetical protein